ncbi:MAG: ferritin-like domain-containing protein [Planctomycetaceae bacterium]|nr:ferritin-like domain-containing protein [Planctomycetaceae bacterium]
MSITGYLKSGMKSLDSMEDLLVEELKDLYDVESRLIEALPEMEEAASDPQLKAAFREHLRVTQGQKRRIEQCFEMLDMEPERETCDGIKGILEEGDALIKADGDPQVKDAALIAAAQRVEHYEIAAYGAARSFAQHLNYDDVADLLQQTLDEEGQTDHKLTEIALTNVNPVL